MWSAIDSVHSVRKAIALIEGRAPSDERCRQIAVVADFARRMISLAGRVEVHTRYLCPSATAANEAGDRWVELLAHQSGGGYCLEFWERRTDVERPPSPERVQDFGEASTTRWSLWAAYHAESWLCRVEGWRWLPPLADFGASADVGA